MNTIYLLIGAGFAVFAIAILWAFARRANRRAAEETEDEFLREFYPMTTPCGTSKTPPGWHCTRALGHEGPCAAVEYP